MACPILASPNGGAAPVVGGQPAAGVGLGRPECSVQRKPDPGSPTVAVRPLGPFVSHMPLRPTLSDAPDRERLTRNGPKRFRRHNRSDMPEI